MKILDRSPLRGSLDITLLDANSGVIVPFFHENNLIVDASKMWMIGLLYSTTPMIDPINTLWVGTGGTSDPQGLYPLVENPLQTGLMAPLLSVPTSYTTPTTPSVTFLADVLVSQGNGSLISEAGLFRTSGAIFNVKNHPAISKTAAFSIHYAWTITLT